jgi:peptidoglycan/xylan/chitin deacetylase (PgdA/CDA1 family)
VRSGRPTTCIALAAALALPVSCVFPYSSERAMSRRTGGTLSSPLTTYAPGVPPPTEFLVRAANDRTASAAGPVFRLNAARTEQDFHTAATVYATRRGRARVGVVFDVDIWPKLLVAGQKNVDVRVRLARAGRDIRFSPSRQDSFNIASQDSGLELRIENVRSEHGDLMGTVAEVPSAAAGWYELGLVVGGEHAEPVPFAIRVVDCVRVALTFDDGPSVERVEYLGRNADGLVRTPTEAVLDVLAAERIAAAFFVLTGPEASLWRWYAKGETPEGFALMCRAAREGHLLEAHWGGRYRRQNIGHPARTADPAYDHDGDGVVDRRSAGGNALETDLLHCVGRIDAAYRAAGRTGTTAEFVRPPVWRCRAGDLDARCTYAVLGLTMVLTDTRLYDGGYLKTGFSLDSWLNRGIDEALIAGHGDLVVTMHDSNPRTARDLNSVLGRLRAHMRGLGLAEGSQWRFVADAGELSELLRAKRVYSGMPSDE